MIWAVLQKSLRLESIRVWKVFLVSVDRPNIALRPCILGYQPSLVIIRQSIVLQEG
jgi:hypothetical protein